MPSIFRDRAIAAQSGNESLDQRVQVVPVRAWIALALALVVLACGALWLFGGTVTVRSDGPATIVNEPGNVTVVAPVEGVVTSESPEVGSHVAAADVVATVASGVDQRAVPVQAGVDGVVVGIGPGRGASVKVGDPLAIVARSSSNQLAYAFVPASGAGVGTLAPGRAAWLLPENLNPTEVGYIRGHVTSVSPLPVPASRISYLLGDPSLAERVAAQGPAVEVEIALDVDPTTPSGLSWTQHPGPSSPVVSGTPATASIDLAELPPYQAFFHG